MFHSGPTSLLKAMVLFFKYYKKKINKVRDLSKKIFILGEFLKLFEVGLKKVKIPVKQFHKDMVDFYLSKYVVEELRKFYTEKERLILKKQARRRLDHIEDCEPDWPVCNYSKQTKNFYYKDPNFFYIKNSKILNNFVPNHFLKPPLVENDLVDLDREEEINKKQQYLKSRTTRREVEEDLLINRQDHLCKYRKTFEEKKEIIKTQRDFIEHSVLSYQTFKFKNRLSLDSFRRKRQLGSFSPARDNKSGLKFVRSIYSAERALAVPKAYNKTSTSAIENKSYMSSENYESESETKQPFPIKCNLVIIQPY